MMQMATLSLCELTHVPASFPAGPTAKGLTDKREYNGFLVL